MDAIVAALDLQLVRLLRQATRSSDIASGRGQPAVPLGPAPTPPPIHSPSSASAAQFEPRTRIEPTPRFEPRPVIHPDPLRPDCSPPIPPPPPVDPEQPRLVQSSIEPPWKKLPWNELETPPAPPPRIKLIIKPPDQLKTGTVFDRFA